MTKFPLKIFNLPLWQIWSKKIRLESHGQCIETCIKTSQKTTVSICGWDRVRTVYRRFVLSFRLQFEENIYNLATNICGLNHLLKNSVSGFSKFLVWSVLSGVEDPRESTVVLLQKVPRRFLFSVFSIRKKFLNIYSLAANFLVTIVCNIIRFWLKYIEGRYINCGTVVRETLGLEICCVIRVRTFPFTTIIRI